MATGSSGILCPHCQGIRKKKSSIFLTQYSICPSVWTVTNPDCAKCPPHSNIVAEEEDRFVIQDQVIMRGGANGGGWEVVIIRTGLLPKGQNAKQTKNTDG